MRLPKAWDSYGTITNVTTVTKGWAFLDCSSMRRKYWSDTRCRDESAVWIGITSSPSTSLNRTLLHPFGPLAPPSSYAVTFRTVTWWGPEQGH